MTRAIGIIAAAVLILLFATLLLVVMPAVQLQSKDRPAEGLKPYSAQARRGRQQYIALGCVYCHTQQPRDPALGPDGKRGWGRPSIPADYAYDEPHLLGTARTGPDLFNIGARQPSQDWHLSHLYNPRAVVPGSIMPAYPFLFQETTELVKEDVVVKLPNEFQPAGVQIVAGPQVLDLVQYLKEMDHTYPVKEIPVIVKAATAKGAP